MPKPTADWERLDQGYYRKVQLYTSVFDQDLDLENHHVVGAPYSGAVAIYRKEENLHLYRGIQSAKPTIDLYSCAGKLLRRINWDKGSIKGLGWSEDEKLLVVTEDGTVRVYYGLQGDFIPFSLGHGAEEHGVKSCRFYSSGFVALLGNNHLVTVSRYDEPRPKILATPPSEPVISWNIISPAYSLSRSVEVLLAIGETIHVVDATESEDRMLQNGPFKHLGVSPNGKYIAMYTDDGKVWVVTSDFQNKLSEYDSNTAMSPKDLQWCGNDAVVLSWEDEVHLVGPNGSAIKYFYDDFVHLISDVDGVRLLTSDVCEFLQKVPNASQEVFRLTSDTVPSKLLDAAEHLEKKSPKADDIIQQIRSNLDEAVDICMRAAGHEYSIHWQKALLRAASFGKSVLDLYNSDDYVDMCETLRVLNGVRFYAIGIPLSYEQYRRLTPEKLVERLTNRHEYLLALKISQYLRLPTDSIYVHWASQKVRASSEDEESICRIIVKRLEDKNGVSFEKIARAAYDEGRARLATELLNYEPRAGKQVPLLLSMKEDTIALDKAIESGDTDLIFYVLLHLKKKLPLASFFRIINPRPVASALVESSALHNDTELLKDLYYQDDRRIEGANLLVSEALAQPTVVAQIDKLKLSSKLLSDSKNQQFQVKAINETQQLLRTQDALEKELDGSSFIGKSVNETVLSLVKNGHSKRAAKVMSDFKVPEKTQWWLRLRGLVQARYWTELEEMSKTKKSPIGWEPFFNALLAAGNTRLAGTFIPKCTSLSVGERIDMWVKCGMIKQAGEEALKAKDMAALESLRAKATGTGATEIERLINQLKQGRR
ncbi:vacuolar sorting-associated protein [Pseudovirgaria hyperparasitica]|uniref:Probable vacuolar protein sorting-associated protein 16 homolog n=1 Tax=Pseudovirgaria hyperparasitica TaxID=470096 RepID=A0A6A6WKI3_9PEZI|nr:vacuolar sorting-associated protein [Pseudovirgaria hyperparasitica]KAF2762704.1 vacuolar sorting-associated protein [Pseudovirgaria hyperparasitica]